MAGFNAIFTAKNTTDYLKAIAVSICNDGIEDNSTVCEGAVRDMADVIVPVLSESVLDPDYFCSQFLGQCDTSYFMFYAE